MSVPVGISIPKILPVVGSFLPGFTAYYIFLNTRVTMSRINTDTMMGTEPSKTDAKQTSSSSNDLFLNSRCQANFVENVPLALIIAAVVEMNGGSRRALTGALAALLAFRVAHVELGIKAEGTKGLGRPIGHFGTMGWMAGMSGYAAYLVKSYWGF